MCSPHGGCQPESISDGQHIDLGKFIDHVWAIKTERDQLKAENERLRESDQESTELCDTLSSLLGQVAVAVRGPEEPKSRHGFHDLPSRVKTVVAERDQLKDENEALRKNADRYQWLRLADWWRSPICVIRNPKEQAKLGSDCPTGERLDIAVDAAMSKGEQS